MKGKFVLLDDYTAKYTWYISLSPYVELSSYKKFKTKKAARQDAMEWAKELNIEVEE